MKKVILLLCALLAFGWGGSAKVTVKNLRLEMKENPVGINVVQPRFSWQISSDKSNLMQVSYQIQVSTSAKDLVSGKNLLWNSGNVKSDRSILVQYKGKALQSEKAYFWRVKITTNQGTTGWSDVNSWSMAMLNPSDWNATWIGINRMTNPGENVGIKDGDACTRLAARYLRKEFAVNKTVKRAVLYMSGLGSSEAYVNGKRISDDIFAPMPSLYDKRVYYNVFDVTRFLSAGQNAIGVILGNGRFFSMRNPGMKTFGFPRLLAQLNIEYTDGSKASVVSDLSWKVTAKGPIVANNEFDGEEYDARLEMPGWSDAGFNDASWQTVEKMEVPGDVLTAQQNPNLCIQDRIRPVAITERADGHFILDMGQNMVGWLSVKLKGRANQPVTMRFAETMQKDNELYVANLRKARATDVYTPSKDGEFTWQPSFVYHGFRFVEISGLDYRPSLSDFTGDVIYDKMETSGQFASSNALVDQIHKNAFWGIRGNYRGMPTDCPQRDERLGWLGDRATGCYGESYILNNSLLYNKWEQDIEDSQSDAGSISDVSPHYWTLYNDDVTWPSAFFYGADMLYTRFGDDKAIRTHYAAMKKWMEHMQSVAMKDYIIVKDTYGDWCMPPEAQELIHSKDPARKTDGAILSTTVYYDLLNKMIKYAKICGKDADILAYKTLAAKMKEAYNVKYFNKETAQYGNNTVTANILSLRLGLVPQGYEQKVFENIVEKTEGDFKGHVSTGVLGIQHLMRGLTDYGRVDLAYKLVTNDTYPSWGYMVKNGATTIWELWNGNTADPAMNSGNHVMLLGDLIIWYYENLAGIKCAPDAVGYKHILMQSAFPKGLDHVSATYKSVYGDISSAWSTKDDQFSWDITIPGNTTATVRIPKKYGVISNSQPGVLKVSETSDYNEFLIASGNYHFSK